MVATALLCAACGGGDPRPDGGLPPPVDGAPLADVLVADANPPLTWVDFAVTGCASFDADGPTCRATAPAPLRFTAIAPAAIDTYLWSFGDGTPVETAASPEHVFARPGSYTVTLTVGGPGGTAQRTRVDFVVVAPAPIGAACDEDAQCAETLECVCGGGEACPPSLSQGICTRPCGPSTYCGAGAVCADLAPAGAPDEAGWRRPLCLASCADDAGCPPHLGCRELRASAGGGWVKACFSPALLLDDGASCVDPTGALDDAACASGHCAPLGARGACATRCPGGTGCPSHAACATFDAPLGAICLLRCAARPCADDPWLACESPGPGALGFSVAEPADPDGYCAPKRCAAPDECGLGGACAGGFCGP